jgi:Sec-independent protein secretion pathway component TatC
LAEGEEDSTDRMSFLDHLEELRVRLIRALISLLVGFALCFGFAERIFHFMTQPLRVAYPEVQFIATEPTETFMLYMKMAFFAGIFLAAPFILYQVWAFIAPDSTATRRLRGAVHPFRLGLLHHRRRLWPLRVVPRTFSFLVDYGDRTSSSCPRSASTTPSIPGSCSAWGSCSNFRGDVHPRASGWSRPASCSARPNTRSSPVSWSRR